MRADAAPAEVKFLLVDDLDENLFALEALLQRDGLRLYKARSGQEALELLLLHDFALALLDVQMDGMDGFELAEFMRGTERTRRVPIIFLTAVATDEQRRFRGYETGAVDFLFKPLNTQMLSSKAGVFFELARQRQELAWQRDELRLGADRLSRALERLEAHADNSPLAIVGFDNAFRMVEWSRSAQRLFGWLPAEAVNRDPAELGWLHQDEMAAFAEFQADLRGGERGMRTFRLMHRDGRVLDTEWYSSVLRTQGGALDSVHVQILDVTERKRAEATQRLLIGELNHRVKNTLATVQAIATQTLRSSPEPEDFARDFSGRIQALAQSHSLLSDATWHGAMLKDLIAQQLRLGTIDDARLQVSGPDIQLPPQTALHLGLILHELTTNANKHGSLSTAEGLLEVAWSITEGGLDFRWTERGAPMASAPTRRGFGTTLIEQGISAEGGEARSHYGPDGVTWHITLPLDVADQVPTGGVDAPVAAPQAGQGERRLLIVEDEPIIALQMAAILEREGTYSPVIAGTVPQALEIIAAAPILGALLDGNLRGASVDEIASALSERGVPFAFVSGYGRDHLPKAFPEAGILAKPFTGAELLRVVTELTASGSDCSVPSQAD